MYANLEGIERRYGGANGYGNKAFQRRVLGLWDHKPAPPRTPIRHLFDRLGMRFGAISPVDFRPLVLDPKGPGIFDQKTTSSCTGQAEIGSTMTRLVIAGNPSLVELSPFDAYRKGRRIDIPILADGKAQPLVDDGAIPEQVTRAGSEHGFCSYDLLPNDPTRVNDEPSLGERENGLRYIVRGIYGMTGVDTEQGVQAALAAGFPVKLGALIDDAFESFAGSGVIAPPDPARILGGHALYVCGWEQLATGAAYFVANSWATSWGEGGFGIVSADWLRQASDFEVVDVTALEAA